ncbi:hypothetical protein PHYPO_G00099850 [Pangasianodon hypophthalmus]|uniref:Uncharacterized protein n=1 Tax=Pangasianodon hypophthalmus TaxID=310915 RepID=A0A5N5PW26_PANHP|nr:hypothetical protein PHYPO_G00099850 [Pangasianodon hypophthalmus]
MCTHSCNPSALHHPHSLALRLEIYGYIRMKRLRTSSSSDSSDNESPSTSFSTNKYGSKPGTPASAQKKPAEVFRKDLISAMKLPDSHHISPDDYYLLADTWRQEWEKGVQVLASPDTIPHPSVRVMAERPKEILFSRPRKYIQCWSQDCTETGYVNIKELAEAMCRYDLDDTDLYWLRHLNMELLHMGEGTLDELTMERTMEALERKCHDNMNHAIETEEGLGIEYDEDVICDVCRSPDSEEGNDMVFCDKCNICVHQACYGIVKVPDGNWLCRTCALWIPEVSIACPERMEPITKLSHIPPSRWSLICSLCKIKTGACIQCSVKNCTIPFHVTCAFEHNLEMKTILDEGDEVKFKSYCLKHSKPKAGEPGLSPARHKPPTETEKVGLRAQKLQELEEEFYKLVQPDEVAQELGLPLHLLDFIYQYWKLKRKGSFNKALLPPKEEEENLLRQPQEDSIHTRMRMFMHLRQDLERVRNLCYMVSRREKLKLSQSKVQEQIFNLHVKLMNQEQAAELPVSSNVENLIFPPPPRITIKLKIKSKTSTKSGNGPLSPDNSSNVYDVSGTGIGQGKPQLQHSRAPREERTNGIVPITKPTGKPLALHAALHGHSAKPEQDRPHQHSLKSNGIMEKPVVQRNPTPPEQGTCEKHSGKGQPGAFHKSTMEHFSRTLKEATVSLVRTTADLWSANKNGHKNKERTNCGKAPSAAERAPKSGGYQESDGYCPDLELSDSEPEAKGKRQRGGRGLSERSPAGGYGRGGTRGNVSLGSRTSVQR